MSEMLAERKIDPDNLSNGVVETDNLRKQSHQHCNGDVPNTTGSEQNSVDMPKHDNIQDVSCAKPKIDASEIDTGVQDTLTLKEEVETKSNFDCSANAEEKTEVTVFVENTQNSKVSSQCLKTRTENDKEEKSILPKENVELSNEVGPKVVSCEAQSENQLISKEAVPNDVEMISVSSEDDLMVLPSPAQIKKRGRPPGKKNKRKKVGRPHEEKDSEEREIHNKFRSPWSKEEDQTLVYLVEQRSPRNWHWIAKQMKNRNANQCRERWANMFSPDGSALKWTEEEEKILEEAYRKMGNNWKEIACLLRGRSINAIKQHWREFLKRKYPDGGGPSLAKIPRGRPVGTTKSSSKSVGAVQISPQEEWQAILGDEPDDFASQARKALLEELILLMPDQWVSRIGVDGAYALKWAPGIHCAVQRAVFASYDGSVLRVIVHSKVLQDDHELYKNPVLRPRVSLTRVTVKAFAAVMISALHVIHDYKLCKGINDTEFPNEWGLYPMLRLDEDLFAENGNESTMRAVDCKYLIVYRRKRCIPCVKYYVKFWIKKNRELQIQAIKTGKVQGAVETEYNENEVRDRLVGEIVANESIAVDTQLARSLEGAFSEAEGVVKLIWEEQNKANAAKKLPVVKWHPLALRWALMKRLTKPGSLCIRVTPQRTLYEYYTDGVRDAVVKRMASEVGDLSDDFRRYVVLGFDEVCVLRNVVYQKATGRIVGYVHLNEVDGEIADLEEELAEQKVVRQTATSMLAHSVKGIANGIRGVVAGFMIEEALTDGELHTKTWDVVWELETAGVKVIAFVGDGGPRCQDFFNRHAALTVTTSGVVYDTLNTYASGRPVFFFNDTRNLLKLIRNCFANSGAHKKTRQLMKNGQVITWKTIVDIFKAEGNKCPKLKSMHVFLNSFSVSEVFVAAQVMSRSVAASIEKSRIPNTAETVKFIRYVNDFYDCLNGASEKPKNENLAPYRSAEDPRFAFLTEFLQYLEEWKLEADAMPIPQVEKQKRKLTSQTLIGIERNVRAFIAAVKFLLETRSDENGFILARTFQLDDGL